MWRNLSSSALNLVKDLIDLMLGGTALNSAEAVDENELNLSVLILLNLELPRAEVLYMLFHDELNGGKLC